MKRLDFGKRDQLSPNLKREPYDHQEDLLIIQVRLRVWPQVWLMKLAIMLAGYLDAGLKLLNSLTAPSIGGDVRISRGVASLMPGGPSAPGNGSGSGSSGQPGHELSEMRARARENDLVLKAFTVLTRKDALARQLSRLDVQQVWLRSGAIVILILSRQPGRTKDTLSFLCRESLHRVGISPCGHRMAY